MGGPPAEVERTASLYVPTRLSGSRLETASAAVIYAFDVALLLGIAATFRRYLSEPRFA